MLGDKLREIIERKYDTYSKFAEECKVPVSTLSDVLNNRKIPRESNLNLYIEKLEPLSEEDKKELIKEWVFARSNGRLRKDVEKLEKENKNMLEVLKEVKNEKELLNEVSNLKKYEEFYNLFFNDLSCDDTRKVLTGMLDMLKIIAFDKGNADIFKERFKEIEKLINDIK